jgi:hypothetical protein
MTALLYVGGLIAFVGGIWLIVVAFKKSVWWGLGSLIVPFVGLIFAILNWQVAKTPFLVYLAGIVLCVIGAMNTPNLADASMAT